MPAPTKNVLYVNYFDVINEPKVKAIMAAIADVLAKQKPDQIYCLFSSGGGNVEAGVTLYNFLRALPVELVMHNTGSTDSIANVVFLAASTRLAAKHSSFMFHGVTWGFQPQTSLYRNQIAEVLSGLDAGETKIRGVLTERTTLTEAEVRELFAQGETKTPEWALSKGIITEIRNPSIPANANFVSFNLQ